MADRPISITVAGLTRSFARFGGAVESDPATGAVLGVDLGVAQVSFVSSARLYRHKDFRGNTSFVSDETGAVVAHYRYSAYGVDLVLGADAADAQRFAGRLELSGGLVLMGARIYDPLVGRFLSQDPVFSALNPYAYTLGNPLDFWDPDGAHQTVAEARAARGDAVNDLLITVLAFTGAVTTAVVVGHVGVVIGAIAVAARLVVTHNNAVRAQERYFRLLRIPGFGPGESGANVGALQGLDVFADGPCTSRCGPGGPGPPPPPSWPEGVNSGCSPANLTLLPNFGPLLVPLVLLQLILAGAVLRRQRRGR